MPEEITLSTASRRTPWNKGKLIGAKPPLRTNQVWSIRTRLMVEGRTRDLATFNLAIDSKLRACDLVKLRVRDVCHGDRCCLQSCLISECGANGIDVKNFGGPCEKGSPNNKQQSCRL